MATYAFDTITAAQALAYNPATETLAFGPSAATSLRVVIDDAHVTITDLAFQQERTVVFGLSLLGDSSFFFSTGSQNMSIGTAGADHMTATAFGTAMFGGDGPDTLVSSGGRDVLDGGAGADVLTPTGVDTVAFDPGQSPVSAPDIVTAWHSDYLTLEFSGLADKTGLYVETSAASLADATAAANQQIASGAADYVAVQVGSLTYLFADDRNDNGVADDMVQLNGVSLSQISVGNIAHATQGVDPPPPTLPVSTGASGTVYGDMDLAHISHLLGQPIFNASATNLNISGPAAGLGLDGTGFTYDANEQLQNGTVTEVAFNDNDPATGVTIFSADLQVPSISAAPFEGWLATDATSTAFSTVLAGSDTLHGGSGTDLIRGFDGNDVIEGGGGSDTIWGGNGNDVIYAGFAPPKSGFLPVGSTYLRGEEGDDTITGGAGFDDINGNQGNDSLTGGAGNDWVVGGKDNDFQTGDEGDDIVWGNLGDDTLDGGSGNDQVRGGQGDDVIFGGAGNDYVSGDRGNDTETGGAGADSFHGSQDAGVDRVLDFNQAEGDRVMLDPGTTYTVSQVGADTVIDMGGGNQMVLVGVQLSSLKDGWIFEA